MRKHNGMRPQDILIILAILADWKKIRAYKMSIESSHQNDYSNQEPGGTKMVFSLSPFTNIPVSNKEMAQALQISESEVSESLYRSEYAGLISNVKMKKVNKQAFIDFLFYGLKYVFPARPSGIGRGFATAHSAPPLSEKIVSEENFIWEHPEGNMRGLIIEPLYKTIPNIIYSSSYLYELLALTDGLRAGNSRVYNLARELIENKINEV
ncbi:MAG: hypothetical protein KF870_07565 [Leadbetterella sp.]|nr:hypothetical protein [Leadbetterella sp.]